MPPAAALLIAVAGPPARRPIEPVWLALGIVAILGAVAVLADAWEDRR
jgi:hypothetical protein